VTSQAGNGTSFAFYVKVRRVEAPHGADLNSVVPEINLPVGAHADDSPSILSDSATVLREPSEVSLLIVEDNLVNQRVLVKQLKTQGFRTMTANDGVECLHVIQRSELWDSDVGSAPRPMPAALNARLAGNFPLKVDLILMDVEMPHMNGTEATARIRELEKSGALLSHVPIIAITANARLEQIAQARDSGMDDVVSKPFRMPELLAKLEVFLGPLKRVK
jgi:CheY-like chemotaxis protein